MKIRKSIALDLAPLSVLFDEYRIFYEKESDLKASYDFLFERMEKEESEIFVAENENGILMGFVQLYPLFSSTRLKKLWLLNDLYVSPNERGKGISVALIEAAKLLCKQTNACGLMLETAKNNVVGNNLYLKTGFLLSEESNYYYWNR
jgi:GNAT superfamily N-acetyltransferase